MKKVTLEDAIDMKDRSKVYRKILAHRKNCKLWMKGFCLDCFGGGLNQFLNDLNENNEISFNNKIKEIYSCYKLGKLSSTEFVWEVKDLIDEIEVIQNSRNI